ncbi:MAG: SPOR domain-containing protein [Gammaproteobacteria bacterium]
MKWIFIFLLVANLVYLGWEVDRQTAMDRAHDDALAIPPHARKLVLLKELPAPPPLRGPKEETVETGGAGATTPGEEAAQTNGTGDVRIEDNFIKELIAKLPDIRPGGSGGIPQMQGDMCFSYGPFPDAQQTKDLLAWFEERQVSVQQRPEKSSENQLYWIYLAPQDSLGDAKRTIEELKSKGVSDYRLIETGDLRNAISLGLFSTQALVNKRLNELRNKGYRPIVVPYREANIIYWVDVKLANQQNVLNQMFTEYPAHFNSVPVECGKIAMLRQTP